MAAMADGKLEYWRAPTAAQIAAPNPDVSVVCGLIAGIPKNVSRKLHRDVTLSPAARHPQFTERYLALRNDAG